MTSSLKGIKDVFVLESSPKTAKIPINRTITVISSIPVPNPINLFNPPTVFLTIFPAPFTV